MILSDDQKERKLAAIDALNSVDGCDWWAHGWTYDPDRPFEGEAERLATRRAEMEKAGAYSPAWKRARG